MDIAAMLLWIFTAGAGVYVLAAGRPARLAVTPEDAGAEAEAEAFAPATVPPSPAQYGIPPAAVQAMAAGARVPPITHTRVTTQPGQHPLLEFMHPALGIVGLGCWLAYVATKFATFAWVSFGVLLAAIAAGLTWYTVNRRAAARARNSAPARPVFAASADGEVDATADRQAAPPAGRRYPPRRILIHGGAAATTLILAILTLLISVHS